MNSTNYSNDSERVFDQFSPKKTILQLQGLLNYVLSKWPVILLVAAIFGIAAGLYSYFKKPQYTAEITFALDEGISPNKTSYSEIGEQLGLEAPNAGGVFSSMSNIVELIRSRVLIERALKREFISGSKRILYADFFLDSLQYREEWIKEESKRNVNFKSVSKNSREELFANSLVSRIYQTLITENISIETKGQGTTIMSVTCISSNELFSKYFLETLLDEVTTYYVQTKTQRSKINLQFLQKRTDSIKNAYYSTLYGRASFLDAHSNPSRQIASVQRDKQQTDVQILRTSYVELVRSLEVAKTALLKDTPLFQFLDTPTLPLKRFNSSVIKNSLVLFIVGMFLTAGYFGLRRVYKFFMR